MVFLLAPTHMPRMRIFKIGLNKFQNLQFSERMRNNEMKSEKLIRHGVFQLE